LIALNEKNVQSNILLENTQDKLDIIAEDLVDFNNKEQININIANEDSLQEIKETRIANDKRRM
jgi:hypothetical protein